MDERTSGPGPGPSPGRPAAAGGRDAGLHLIRRATGWLVAGAITSAGVISVAAADAFHGRTLHQGSASTSSVTSSPPQLPPLQSSGNAPGLQAPAQAPAPAPAAPSPVVSGGS
jgi:hypothetical protein